MTDHQQPDPQLAPTEDRLRQALAAVAAKTEVGEPPETCGLASAPHRRVLAAAAAVIAIALIAGAIAVTNDSSDTESIDIVAPSDVFAAGLPLLAPDELQGFIPEGLAENEPSADHGSVVVHASDSLTGAPDKIVIVSTSVVGERGLGHALRLLGREIATFGSPETPAGAQIFEGPSAGTLSLVWDVDGNTVSVTTVRIEDASVLQRIADAVQVDAAGQLVLDIQSVIDRREIEFDTDERPLYEGPAQPLLVAAGLEGAQAAGYSIRAHKDADPDQSGPYGPPDITVEDGFALDVNVRALDIVPALASVAAALRDSNVCGRVHLRGREAIWEHDLTTDRLSWQEALGAYVSLEVTDLGPTRWPRWPANPCDYRTGVAQNDIPLAADGNGEASPELMAIAASLHELGAQDWAHWLASVGLDTPDGLEMTATPSTEPSSTDANAGDALWDRTFIATSDEVVGAPIELVEESDLTLHFDGEASDVQFDAGCNRAGGDLEFGDGRLVIAWDGATTDMFCGGRQGAEDLWFFEVMDRDPHFTLDGTTLVLSADDGTVITLLDREIVDPDRPLVGPVWELDDLALDEDVYMPNDPRPTIEFKADGVVIVNDGCNFKQGTYTVDGDSMEVADTFFSTDIGCSIDTRAVNEPLFFSGLTFSVDADILTMRDDEGHYATFNEIEPE